MSHQLVLSGTYTHTTTTNFGNDEFEMGEQDSGAWDRMSPSDRLDLLNAQRKAELLQQVQADDSVIKELIDTAQVECADGSFVSLEEVSKHDYKDLVERGYCQNY